MDVVARTLRWQRWTVCAVLAGAALGFTRSTLDVFNTTKATIILAGALGVVLLAAYRASRTRRVSVPRSPVVAAAAVLAIAFVLATITSPLPVASLVGRPGRHTGLAAYLTYLVLFVVVTRLYRDHAPTDLVRTLLAAAAPVTAYGLLQAAGVEPLGWRAVEGGPQVFSTFGNANFFAAFLGIVVPLAAWGALTRTWSAPWRAASAALAVAAFAATVLSNSQQGPAIALAGTALVLGVAVAASRLPFGARLGLLGGAALLGGAVVAAVAAGVGPLGSIRASLVASLGTRTPKWETALAIWRDHPVLGVGLERYADYFHEYRPASLAAATGLRRTTDTPHDIPLDMLANGGLVLALAYVAFVGLTGFALVVGLRRNRGEDRLLLAGVGGAWVAYQLQSLVSIDVPPIAVLHYVLAGLVVALGTRPALATLRLPGARPDAPARAGGPKRAKGKPPRPQLAPANPLVTLALAVVGVAGLVAITTPLRADFAAARGVRLGAAQPDAATDAYRQAADTAFWESRYPGLLGSHLAGQEPGRAEDALAAHREAARREPRALGHALSVARLEAQLGRLDEADATWDRILQIDPQTPEVLAEAGTYRLGRGDVELADQLLERAVEMRGDDATLWVALGQVRAAARDTEQARAAFQRALQLDPQVQGGMEGLAQLDAVA